MDPKFAAGLAQLNNPPQSPELQVVQCPEAHRQELNEKKPSIKMSANFSITEEIFKWLNP